MKHVASHEALAAPAIQPACGGALGGGTSGGVLGLGQQSQYSRQLNPITVFRSHEQKALLDVSTGQPPPVSAPVSWHVAGACGGCPGGGGLGGGGLGHGGLGGGGLGHGLCGGGGLGGGVEGGAPGGVYGGGMNGGASVQQPHEK